MKSRGMAVRHESSHAFQRQDKMMSPADRILHWPKQAFCIITKIVSLDTSSAATEVLALGSVPYHHMNGCSESGPFPMDSDGYVVTPKRDLVA